MNPAYEAKAIEILEEQGELNPTDENVAKISRVLNGRENGEVLG